MPDDVFIANQANAWAEISSLYGCEPLFGPPAETANGPGSTLAGTGAVRERLPQILRRYSIRTMLDAPCGDWNWMRHVNLTGVEYLGWDVDPVLVELCSRRVLEGDCTATFKRANLLTVSAIPEVDLVLCRDFLAHLPTNEYVGQVLDKIRAKARYLLASSYSGADNGGEFDPHGTEHTWMGYFERPVNLEAPPFSLPGKLESIPEDPGPHGVISQPHELALFKLH